jgi:hypothetical protein
LDSGQQLGTRLGQSEIVDNRPGGGTSTATKAVGRRLRMVVKANRTGWASRR